MRNGKLGLVEECKQATSARAQRQLLLVLLPRSVVSFPHGPHGRGPLVRYWSITQILLWISRLVLIHAEREHVVAPPRSLNERQTASFGQKNATCDGPAVCAWMRVALFEHCRSTGTSIEEYRHARAACHASASLCRWRARCWSG